MSDDLVVVYTAGGPAQANLVKSLLEAEGIPVMSVQEGAGAAYGLMIGPMGEVTILVPAIHAETARALLMDAGVDEPSDEDEEEEAEEEETDD